LVGRSQRVLRRINCRWVLVSSSLEFGLFFRFSRVSNLKWSWSV
jgi:hypothetical protein